MGPHLFATCAYLRRDIYEGNVHLYWVENPLEGRRLNLVCIETIWLNNYGFSFVSFVCLG